MTIARLRESFVISACHQSETGLVRSHDQTLSMDSDYLTASEAADRLGVSRSTLYAYVSRGLVHSEPDKVKRRKRYRSSDIEALLAKKTERGNATRALAGALSWGEPLCESELTLIEGGKLYYRGRSVTKMAVNSSFEEVVGLLWGQPCRIRETMICELPAKASECEPVEAFRLITPWLAAADQDAFDLRPSGVCETGQKILANFFALQGELDSDRLARGLGKSWGTAHWELLETALILCSDHELNVSAFTARCVASSGATPYEVVGAGLGALSGFRHGGHCYKVEALFAEALQSSPEEAIRSRLRRGDPVPGFGHPLYPSRGDPRGRCLLKQLEGKTRPNFSGLPQFVSELRECGTRFLKEEPNIDFALVALCHTLSLPKGAAIALFALGRTAGWLAHAIEQYQLGTLIRPRARYVGLRP